MGATMDAFAQELAIGEGDAAINYKSQPIAFGLGLKALLRLVKIASPIMSAALRARGAFEESDPETGKLASVAALLDALPQHLGEEDVNYFSTLFGAASWYQGSEGQWVPLIKNAKHDAQADHFAARYYEYFQWLVFNIKVNFAGFFDGVREGKDFATLADVMKGSPNPSSVTPGKDGTGES